jgi:uncharacterized protein
MITMRNILKIGGLALACLVITPATLLASGKATKKATSEYVSQRPPLAERNFVSPAIEKAIKSVKKNIKDPKLAWMFENCFPNTLDTTVEFEMVDGKPDTFVITGDIHAMWLRDSSAQVYPYLKFVKEDGKLKLLVEGVIRR